MTRRGAVEHDEIVCAFVHERFDAAEHQNVSDPRSGGGDDIEGAGLHEAISEATETLIAKPFDEGMVRRDLTGVDPFRQRHDLVAQRVGRYVSLQVFSEETNGVVSAVDRDEQYLHLESSSRRHGDGRHGSFANPALASDDDELGFSQPRLSQLRSLPRVPQMKAPIMALCRRLLMLFAVALLGAAVFLPAAQATSPTPSSPTTPATPAAKTSATNPTTKTPAGRGPFVDIIEVAGYIDPVNAQFVENSLLKAKRDGAQALLIQLDSPGSLLSPEQQRRLDAALTAPGRVPVLVWVGPDQARARRGALDIYTAADVKAVASNTALGPALGQDPRFGDGAISGKEAVKRNIADFDAPTLVEFIGQLDGRTIAGVKLDTADEDNQTTSKDGRTNIPLRTVRFQRLGLFDQLLHTATNPGIVYLLFAIGLALMVFEFYTGGVGIAAGVGLVCFLLGAYGLGILPTNLLGVALLLLAFFGFAVDVQAGQPRFWTAVGTISLVVGSFLLFTNGVSVPIWWIGIVTVMIVTFMVGGMPTMIRTRFATPTIGRESMIGEFGVAKTAVSPDGVVEVRGAPWKARTNRATPLKAGDQLRVASIDGLVLEVEPLEGAARDHRERATSKH